MFTGAAGEEGYAGNGSEHPGRQGVAAEVPGWGHWETARLLTGASGGREAPGGQPREARRRRGRAGGAGDLGAPVTEWAGAGVGWISLVRGVRWGKGRRQDSGCGQSPGLELPYLKGFSNLP